MELVRGLVFWFCIFLLFFYKMQTFLCYNNVVKSLKCLSPLRLRKQVVEASQLINVLQRGSGGWHNHPAARMYRGCLPFLIEYYNTAFDLASVSGTNFVKLQKFTSPPKVVLPEWLGNDRLHESHRANLWRKAYDDANGLKRDGSIKRPSFSQFEVLVEEQVEQPKDFYSMEYYWPC